MSSITGSDGEGSLISLQTKLVYSSFGSSLCFMMMFVRGCFMFILMSNNYNLVFTI